jgi:pimeloyl-ACP methyl ester carboxylesterase
VPFLAPEGRYVDVLGARIHVLELGDGAGAPVVVLHGGGPGCSAWADFYQVVDLLPGRRLVLVDLPQYGRSSVPDVREPVFAFHARHVGAVLAALRIGEADFVCQSLGGGVALRLAADAPQVVRRLVATGCQPVPHLTDRPPLVTGPAARARYYGGSGPSVEAMRQLIAAHEWYDTARVPPENVCLRHAQSTRAEDLELARDPRRRGEPEDLTGLLGDVTADVLLLWGAHDPFVPPDYAVTLAGRLACADVLVLGRTSHHPQSERPRDYAAAVRSFLDPC